VKTAIMVVWTPASTRGSPDSLSARSKKKSIQYI
jgi:hypothetical protein